MKPEHMNAVLCYVKDNFAYFTTKELADQTGDDWEDAPYEHNAGAPYEWLPDYDGEQKGIPKWDIVQVAYSGDFDTPRDGTRNSNYSVQQINAGAVAWLVTTRWTEKQTVCIPAGTTLEKFIELVHKGGGEVYLPIGGSCGDTI